MIAARKLSSAMSAAKAACDHMKSWVQVILVPPFLIVIIAVPHSHFSTCHCQRSSLLCCFSNISSLSFSTLHIVIVDFLHCHCRLFLIVIVHFPHCHCNLSSLSLPPLLIVIVGYPHCHIERAPLLTTGSQWEYSLTGLTPHPR